MTGSRGVLGGSGVDTGAVLDAVHVRQREERYTKCEPLEREFECLILLKMAGMARKVRVVGFKEFIFVG